MKRKAALLLCLACILFIPALTGCGAGRAEQEESVPEVSLDDQEQTSGMYPRDLLRGELLAFTNWIDNEDNYGNYGFLLSEYTDPREADLNQIFYTGAGMETEPLGASEK